MKLATALGLLLCAGHAAAFLALVTDPPPPFEVRVQGPPASAHLALEAELPPELRARVRRVDGDGGDDAGPGLRRVRWRAEYRGGFVRSVGATQLVGPFHDPATPPCSGRVVLGQRLLDDGAAGPGTIARVVHRLLEQQLAGQGGFPIGGFRGVRGLALAWAEPAAHREDAAMLAEAERGTPAPGYLRATAVVSFDRVDVPIALVVVPRLEGERLAVRVAARARLAFGNRVAQWLSDLIGADRLADTLARRQLGQLVIAALEPPPPVPLPGGGELRFLPCGRQPEIAERSHAALPFAVAVVPLPGHPLHLPPLLPSGPAPPPLPPAPFAPSAAADAAVAQVALELDLNALNALLYGAWRDGFLDRQLAAAGLDARFNGDPTVATYLSLRIAPPRLTLPPVVTASGDRLRLSTESTVELVDGDTRTLGRVWTAMQLAMAAPRDVAPAISSSASSTSSSSTSLRASLHQLELTCEPRPHVLAPCYAELVAAMQARAVELDESLTAALSSILGQIFVDRTLGGTLGGTLGDAPLPAELTVRAVTPSLRTGGGAAALRLELTVELGDLHDRAR